MTGNRCRTILTVLSLVALLARWSFGCARATEVIVGFWVDITRCATNTGRLRVGILPGQTSKTARELRRGCNRKTSLFVKKSTKPPCLKRLSEPPLLCKLCSRASPKLHQAIPRFSSRVKREQARSWLHALFTGDLRGLDVPSSA